MTRAIKHVAIIGAGLAGTACAYVLKKQGFEPVIYEAGASIAPGASGNARGLYNPRLSADKTPESEFYAAGFFAALEMFEEFKNIIDWNPCGALHLMTDETKKKRFRQCAANWGWSDDDMRILSAAEASAVAGIEIAHDALYLPRSGFVSPRKLCTEYARGIEVHLNTEVHNLESLKADAIIIAGGMGAQRFLDLPLKAVRGQVTEIATTTESKNIQTCLCYGGYVTPASGGSHMVGSTFQRWLDHSEIIEHDDADNIVKMKKAIPALSGEYTITGQRAAVRTTTADHRPVIGRLKGGGEIYVSTAHGSHGIVSSLMGAHLITAMLGARISPLPPATVERFSAQRFTA